ncbi:DNA processing protein [Duganella sp. CF402]|uniref:DNA-processing protein DprA n=1 Tax=unclassified Duganella TaxID=2636909 RepID=UPI0008B37C85|nr:MULTISPECIES: DNA-processing protein DprA [unclassified Duganella]RZT03850.1 DNA processing protein [Duganella sp. BK701]SEM57414.1 DNA processing protein [Duganella sp. CF402]
MQATDSTVELTRPALAGWLRLQQTGGVGLLTAHKLLERFLHPQAIFDASRSELLEVVSARQADALLAPPSGAAAACIDEWLDAMLAWQAQPGHRLLPFDHPDYPDHLRHIVAAPLLLYLKGRAELLACRAVAVVGSRNASRQGVLNAERMAQTLSDAGVTVVSGLALGIDAAAHLGGLSGPGGTIAVLGTGIDRIYPARNGALARRIAEEGCLVSECPLGTPPSRDNFPRRNRIISGLSRGVLVVEAASQSGSLITARLAVGQGRDVYAVPGSIHATLSKGCHELIREGARLVESGYDVLQELQMQADAEAGARGRFTPDDSFVDRILDAMGDDPLAADLLALHLGQAPGELQGQLLALELAGLLERLPGGMFQRLRV